MALKKYITLAKAGIIESLQFRLSAFILFVGNLLYLTIIYFLWKAIYASSGTDVVKYGDEHKLMAVTEAVCGTDSVFRICAKYGISGTTLDNWRNQLMGIDSSPDMLKDKKKSGLKQHKPSDELQDDELLREYEKLRQEAEEREALLHKVSLERDVLKVTLQILKK